MIHFSGPTISAKPASLVHWKAEPAVNFLRPFPHFRHTSHDRISLRVSESFSPCLHSSWDFRPLFNHLLGIFCCGWLHFELRFYSPLQLSDSISEIVLKEVSPLSFLSPFICFSLLFSLCRFQFILPQPIDGTFYCGSVRRRCLWRLIFFLSFFANEQCCLSAYRLTFPSNLLPQNGFDSLLPMDWCSDLMYTVLFSWRYRHSQVLVKRPVFTRLLLYFRLPSSILCRFFLLWKWQSQFLFDLNLLALFHAGLPIGFFSLSFYLWTDLTFLLAASALVPFKLCFYFNVAGNEDADVIYLVSSTQPQISSPLTLYCLYPCLCARTNLLHIWTLDHFHMIGSPSCYG